jgi:hypothetical protein
MTCVAKIRNIMGMPAKITDYTTGMVTPTSRFRNFNHLDGSA